jgi:hypothetical protein
MFDLGRVRLFSILRSGRRKQMTREFSIYLQICTNTHMC